MSDDKRLDHDDLGEVRSRVRALFTTVDQALTGQPPVPTSTAIETVNATIAGLHRVASDLTRRAELERRTREQADEVAILATLEARCETPPGTPGANAGEMLADAATATLLGQWELASRALTWVHAGPRPTSSSLSRVALALDDLAALRPQRIRSLEGAVRLLQRWSEVRRLRGALLIELGRCYRDIVGCAELAAAAFDEARPFLSKLDVEPMVEQAELLRRAGRLEEAHRLAEAACTIRPGRPGGWLVRAFLAEDESRHGLVDELSGSAVDMLMRFADPVTTLARLTPARSRSATAFFALAKRLESIAPDHARAAVEHALDVATAGRIRGTHRFADAEAYALRARLRCAAGDGNFVDDLYEQGRRLTWRGAHQDAAVALREALRGRKYFQACAFQLSDALRMHHQAVVAAAKTDPVAERRLIRRAEAISTMAMRWAPITAETAWGLQARALVLSASSQTPDDPRTWASLACAERGLWAAPEDPGNWMAAIRFHLECGSSFTAVELSRQALQAFAPTAALLEAHVHALSDAGLIHEAYTLLPQLSETGWKQAVHAYLLLRLHDEPDGARLKEALKAVQSAIATGMAGEWVQLLRATCLRLIGDHDGARAVVASLPVRATTPTYRAEAALWTHAFDEAVRHADEGLRGPKDRHELLLIRGLALLARGDHDDARDSVAAAASSMWGRVAAMAHQVVVHETRAIPVLGSDAGPATRAVLEAAAAAFKERVAFPAPYDSRGELKARLEASDAREPARRVALMLALARVEHGLAGVGVAAREAAGVWLDLAGRLESSSVGEALEALDREARHEAQWALRRGEVAAAADLVTRQMRSEAASRPRGSWSLAMAMIAAARGDGEACAAAVADLAQRPDEVAAPAHRVASWLATTAQAIVVAAAAERHGLATLAGVVNAWINDHLGLRASANLRAEATLTIDLPPAGHGAELQRVAYDATEEAGLEFGLTLPPADVRLVSSSDSVVVRIRGVVMAQLPLPPEAALAPAELASWLASCLRPHLAELVDVTEVVTLIDLRGLLEAPFAVHRLGHVNRLTRLVRAFLRERIPLMPFQPIAAAALAKRHSTLDDQVSRARRRVPLLSAVPDEAKAVPVEPWIESVIGSKIVTVGTSRFLAALPSEIDAVLTALELATDGAAPVLLVESAAVRPWLRRVVLPVHRDAQVFTREEWRVRDRVGPSSTLPVDAAETGSWSVGELGES